MKIKPLPSYLQFRIRVKIFPFGITFDFMTHDVC